MNERPSRLRTEAPGMHGERIVVPVERVGQPRHVGFRARLLVESTGRCRRAVQFPDN